MMLTEVTPIPGAALPVQNLKDHLRMGSGFGDDSLQDGILADQLRAAIALVEGQVSKAILTRRFLLTLTDWHSFDIQPLPLAPVVSVTTVVTRDRLGVATTLSADRYALVQDIQRPQIAASGYLLPTIPHDGRAEIVFDAGFGPAWADVPAGLAQAILITASALYEHRTPEGTAGLPAIVQRLLDPWRVIRQLGPRGRA
jgi:uncharacterized phiE125 gp8 family phage protein